MDFPPWQRREHDRRLSRLDEQWLELQCVIERMGQDDRGKKRHIADAQEGKRSKGPFQRRCMCMIVGQNIEQVTQELPKDEQHHEIAARDNAKQYEGRKTDQGKEM